MKAMKSTADAIAGFFVLASVVLAWLTVWRAYEHMPMWQWTLLTTLATIWTARVLSEMD